MGFDSCCDTTTLDKIYSYMLVILSSVHFRKSLTSIFFSLTVTIHIKVVPRT